MSLQKAQAHLSQFHLADQIRLLDHSSATVALAAEALGTEPRRIAKTMSFQLEDAPILIVAAGDAKVENKKFKAHFHTKAKMIPAEQVEEKIGHAPGGVCPFGVKDGVRTYLDVSLRRFETVFPAAGTGNSAIELTIPQLEETSQAVGWVDVCKDWQDAAE
jgi:prolyl-tRNA editing enzyme YbaK/EbsC (Cys-tRNA(Pro) deacylase)